MNKKRKRKRNWKKLDTIQLCNAIFKEEYTTIKLKEESKMCYRILSWILIIIISSTLVKNMLS